MRVVIVNIDMFCPVMFDIVLGKGHSGLIVDKQRDRAEYMMEVGAELKKPDAFCGGE